MKNIFIAKLLALLGIIAFIPNIAAACACGCGVFDVSTGGILPNGQGGTAFLEYDFNDQKRNWSGTSSAPAADNDDKRIRSSFYTTGVQYMFNRSWGGRIAVPYLDRHITSADEITGNIMSFQNNSIGDIRIEGIYSGFSADMSTGVTYGLKLPTGEYREQGIERDAQIGSGSTDALIGAYHMDRFAKNDNWSWFAQAKWQSAFITSDHYRPGDEINAAAGIYYDAGPFGRLSKVAPLIQLISSNRFHDSGAEGDSDNTGYQRLLIAPGIEADLGSARVYGDVEFPIYENVNGNQLVASQLFKIVLSYAF